MTEEIKGIKEIGIYKDGTIIFVKDGKFDKIGGIDEVIISNAKLKKFEVEINNEIGPIGLEFYDTLVCRTKDVQIFEEEKRFLMCKGEEK